MLKGPSSGFGKQPPLMSPADVLNGRNSSTGSIHNNSCGVPPSQSNKTPTAPVRTTRTSQTPVPYPRSSLSVGLMGPSGAPRTQESPKPLRHMRGEATSSPKPQVRGAENSSLSHKTSSVKFSPAAPSSPRLRGPPLQRRSPSPVREQGQLPQRMTGSTSSSLDLSCRGTSGSPGAPASPQWHRTLAPPPKTWFTLSPPSLHGLDKEPGSRSQLGPACLGSVSALSPLPSPHSQRKTSSLSVTGSLSREGILVRPYTRERKNSISEISDNEDELLEYHRRQREERLREQETEKLVGNQSES